MLVAVRLLLMAAAVRLLHLLLLMRGCCLVSCHLQKTCGQRTASWWPSRGCEDKVGGFRNGEGVVVVVIRSQPEGELEHTQQRYNFGMKRSL